MRRMIGGLIALLGAAVTGCAIYGILIVKGLAYFPGVGYQEPAYMGAAGLALLTFGIISFQK